MFNKILLVAINTKYIHSNLAIYTLRSYAKSKGKNVDIAEYTINNLLQDIVIDIYEKEPDFIGFSCYLWNIEMIKKIVDNISILLPNTKIWLGGPEVSYESESMLRSMPSVDGIMVGEGEETLVSLLNVENEDYTNVCGIIYRSNKDIQRVNENNCDGNEELKKCICENNDELLENINNKEFHVNMCNDYMNMDDIPFPYEDMTDFENRIIYYESSRGCPYSCSYCMSSVDKRVRFRNIDMVKSELKFFIDNKVTQVKFVDRTFNCDHIRTMEIIRFIKEIDNGITNFHFEISADILTEDEIRLINSLRVGLIQLEIGVQTTNEETIKAINRKMNLDKLRKNVYDINFYDNVHQHLDLIAGLPYEDIESFKMSFEDVYSMKPKQLQLGFLKVLKGAYMYDMAKSYGIVYDKYPPYEVLFTRWLSFDDVILLKQVEEVLEIYYNSGQFTYSIAFLEHFFKGAFAMYEYIAINYNIRGYAKNSHNRVDRYRILLDICEDIPGGDDIDFNREAFIETLQQLLTHDLYMRENMKNRPDFACDISSYKSEINSFYKDEEKLKQLLDGYDAYDSKQIARMTHLEHYDINLYKTSESGVIIKKECNVLYDYMNRNIITNDAKSIILTRGGIR